MSRNQSHRTMSLFIGMILISIIMSYYNVEAFGRNNIEDDYTGAKHLRQLLRQLQMDNDEESFLRKRVEAEGDCTGDIIQGYKWDGKQSMSMEGIDTTQRCMDNCDLSETCVGWTYDAKTKMCWGFSSILGVDTSFEDKSGSCIGRSIKTKCTEKQNGQYSGNAVEARILIKSPEVCIKICDELNTCYGWVYSKDEQKCNFYDSIGEFEASKDDDGFICGSCIAPQKRRRLAERLSQFRQESLERHNLQRAKHCSPALELDDDLNKLSQDLAIKMARDDVMPPVYEENGMQNVFYGKADAARSCSTIVDCFYDEREYYNLNNPDFSVANSFPKVIWKNSANMGVGRAFASDNQTMYVVMTYDGQGGLTDAYKENVLEECNQ